MKIKIQRYRFITVALARTTILVLLVKIMSSVIFKMVKMVLRKVSTKLMDKVGSKIVSGMADTSSDAPNAFYKPKRDVQTSTTK